MFKPKNGVSEATKMEKLLCDYPEGTIITYDVFENILGRDIRDINNGGRTAFYQFERRMYKRYGKVLKNVRGIGYMVAFPTEVPDFVHHRSKRVYGQLTRDSDRMTAAIPKLDDSTQKAKAVEQQNLLCRARSIVGIVRRKFKPDDKPKYDADAECLASRRTQTEQTEQAQA
jgi:hypothetical protein